MIKTCYSHCHSGRSVLRTTYQPGLPLVEQGALLRVKQRDHTHHTIILFHYNNILYTHLHRIQAQGIHTKGANTIRACSPHIGCTSNNKLIPHLLKCSCSCW